MMKNRGLNEKEQPKYHGVFGTFKDQMAVVAPWVELLTWPFYVSESDAKHDLCY